MIRTSAKDGNGTPVTLLFAGGSGRHCQYTDQLGHTRETYAVFADGYGRLAKPELVGLWPLQTGNHAEFQVFDGDTGPSTAKWLERHYFEAMVVRRRERVSVAAGTFDSFLIEWTERQTDANNRSEALVRFWYAPEVGYIVKSAVVRADVSSSDPFGAALYDGLTYEVTEIDRPAIAPALPPSAAQPAPAAEPGNAREAPVPAAAADRLRTLKQLLDDKLITPKEYEQRRKTVLESL